MMSPRSLRSSARSSARPSPGASRTERPPPRSRWLAAAALALGLGLGLGLGACYDTPQPACAFACARQTNECPAGYACDPRDLICHRELSGGALAACEQPFVDAAPSDARPDGPAIDAGADATIDAPTDAAIDAP